MQRAALLFGGNLKDVEQLFLSAKRLIEWNCGRVLTESRLYQSEAWGFESDHYFLNQAVLIETVLSPENLLKKLLHIEKILGRTRMGEGYQDRMIDIDIIHIEDQIIDDPSLQVPHPRMTERMFCLLPIHEVSRNWIHPVLKQNINELMDNCKDKSSVEAINA